MARDPHQAAAGGSGPQTTSHHTGPEADARLRRRYGRERRFKFFGLGAITLALAGLAWLLITVLSTGVTALWTHEIDLEIALDPQIIDPGGTGDPAVLRRADYRALLAASLQERFPDVRAEIADSAADLSDIEARASAAQQRADALNAAIETQTADLLGLVDEPLAEEELLFAVLDNPERIGDAVTVTVPGSDGLAAYLDGDTQRLSAGQRSVIAGLEADADADVARTDGGGVRLTFRVPLDEAVVDPRGRRDEGDLERAPFDQILALALAGYGEAGAGPLATALAERRAARAEAEALDRTLREQRRRGFDLLEELLGLVSVSGASRQLRDRVVADPDLVGTTVSITAPVDTDVDQFLKGYIQADVPEDLRALTDREIGWVEGLRADGLLRSVPNWSFFTSPDSQDPALAGIASALAGTALLLVLTMILSVPIGVAAAIYLEEFAPRNRLVSFIEVNINNLAAVPSIVFGLLGLAVFINFFGLPLSSPLVGGLVLTLMTLPTVIISTRAALRAVPPSIREGALGVGASPLQTVFHHVLPLAMPGIMTGSIIGMAQALGETAPLLLIGMVAFVTEVPTSFTEPAAALPVQVFLWADRPEQGFRELTSLAIMVLLSFMVLMNGLAIALRSRFERRW